MPMGNWGDVGSGALTGAGIGSAILPGIGTAIGAGLGGLAGGLFGGATPPQQYTNPYQGMIDSQIYNLLNSHLGAQMATRQAGLIQHNARLQMQQIGNTPGMNSDMLDNLYNRTQMTAQNSTIDANLAGNQMDLQRASQGANLASQMGRQNFDIFNYNTAMANRPTFLQTLGMQGASSLAGYGFGQMLGGFGPSDNSGGGGGANPANTGSSTWNSMSLGGPNPPAPPAFGTF